MKREKENKKAQSADYNKPLYHREQPTTISRTVEKFNSDSQVYILYIRGLYIMEVSSHPVWDPLSSFRFYIQIPFF